MNSNDTMVAGDVPEAPGSTREWVDPFEYWPAYISRVGGLGGGEPGHDADYVFHTAYHQCRPGLVVFRLRFDGLTASRGTLVLRVNSMTTGAVPHLELANITQIPLRDVIVAKGEAAIAVNAREGHAYACFGHIFDETDSSATSLTVALESYGDNEHALQALGVQRSHFGERSVHAANQLVSEDDPTLAYPVSQMFTPAQIEEPTYAGWHARLGLASPDPAQCWKPIYIAQSLTRYGMLEGGSRGIGLTKNVDLFTGLMKLTHCEIALSGPSLVDLVDPTASSLLRFDVDMSQLPSELKNFDYLWSCDISNHLGSAAAGSRFIEDAMRLLKPGGLAVHVTEVGSLGLNSTKVRDDALPRREDYQRLALLFMSRGHEVAQMKFDFSETGPLPGDRSAMKWIRRHGASKYQDIMQPFGFIVRKSYSGK